jgi:hypothetical protein
MPQTTIDTLFSLLLVGSGAPLGPELEAQLDAALAGPGFGSALDQLQTHRVLPLLAHRLEQHGRLSTLAGAERARLIAGRSRVRELNGLLFLCATRLLHTAGARGISPLVLKGLLLADSYYPDPSTRPMGDLDLVAPPGELGPLVQALEESGFSRVLDHVAQDHALPFENAQGVSCDAHAYIESFPHVNWSDVTREASLRRVRGVRVRVLEPNLMLAHLVDHLHGHSEDSGLVLLWLVDIAFVLREHTAEFEPAKLRRLMAGRALWSFFLRVLGLLERHGLELPSSFVALRPVMRRLPRLSLDSVMRGRRTIPWGLPMPAGYLRVLLQRLSLRDYSQHSARTPPTLRDLCLQPFDQLTTRWAELARYRD